MPLGNWASISDVNWTAPQVNPAPQPSMEWDINKAFKMYYGTTGDPGASQSFGESRDLEAKLAESKESLHREMGELANALEEISRLVEVVQDIGSQAQERITTLLQVANQLETKMPKKPQSGSSHSGLTPSVKLKTPPLTDQLVGAAGVEAELDF